MPPALLLSLAIGCSRGRRDAKWVLLFAGFPIAYCLGGFIGWNFRPFNWNMSFPQTLRANFADHSIEYYAERVLLFVMMTGSVGAWLFGIAAAVGSKWHGRIGQQSSIPARSS
jgi:hypothetical protein